MKSTPIKEMEKATAIQPLSEWRDTKIMIQAEKLKYLPNDPMKQRMEGLTKSRLKHRSFIDQSGSLLREHQVNLLTKTLPFVQQISHSHELMSNLIYRSLYLSHRLPRQTPKMTWSSGYWLWQWSMYPEESWICPYTDCSSTNVTNGGAVMFIKFPSGNISTAEEVPASTHSSKYNAETQALLWATTTIKGEKEACQHFPLRCSFSPVFLRRGQTSSSDGRHPRGMKRKTSSSTVDSTPLWDPRKRGTKQVLGTK